MYRTANRCLFGRTGSSSDRSWGVQQRVRPRGAAVSETETWLVRGRSQFGLDSLSVLQSEAIYPRSGDLVCFRSLLSLGARLAASWGFGLVIGSWGRALLVPGRGYEA